MVRQQEMGFFIFEAFVTEESDAQLFSMCIHTDKWGIGCLHVTVSLCFSDILLGHRG